MAGGDCEQTLAEQCDGAKTWCQKWPLVTHSLLQAQMSTLRYQTPKGRAWPPTHKQEGYPGQSLAHGTLCWKEFD